MRLVVLVSCCTFESGPETEIAYPTLLILKIMTLYLNFINIGVSSVYVILFYNNAVWVDTEIIKINIPNIPNINTLLFSKITTKSSS